MNQHQLEECSMRLLPDDVLAEMLRRVVSPRDLAASRCVCTAWRELIDGRHLLRSDLLPHKLAGLLINYNEMPLPDLFRRPSISAGSFRFSRGHHYYNPHRTHVRDHCNGVILLYGGLLNPATGWWVPLPEFPTPCMGIWRKRNFYFHDDMHLVFDPAVSPHCEVFLIPRVSRGSLDGLERAVLESEWPPSPFIVHVFSTATGRWTERVLIRDGEAIGTVAEMRLDKDERSGLPRLAAYWRGALYVTCEKDFTMRMSLSDNRYRVIKPPCGAELELRLWPTPVHLARSEKGVYFAFFDEEGRLWAWVLDESCSRMEWVLRHSSFVGLKQPVQNYVSQHVKGPWILENTNREKGETFEAPAEQESEWNSDDDEDRDGNAVHYRHFGLLAFHPYKEIVFLVGPWAWRGVAYHLSSSKLEILGDICPKYYSKWVMQRSIEECFPYTPCMIYGGELPTK